MKIVIDLPDKYVYRWFNLMRKMKIESFDGFILQAIGVGVQTMDAAYKIKSGLAPIESNVIDFDKNYYWKN